MATDLCYPSWTPKFKDIIARGQAVLHSGCATVDGNVQCKPEDMRAKAEAQLKAANWFPADKKLSLEAYTLARYMQGEVGSTRLFEAIAVGEAAVNRAKLGALGRRSVLDVLLYRQAVGNPHRGFYGPIHGPEGVTAAPYGRWATTSVDPTIAAVMMADLILSGGSGNFNHMADDQDGMQYAKAFPSPEAKLLSAAKAGNYWVGPLPGVDHWRTTQYRHYGYAFTSLKGVELLTRANAVFGAAARFRDGDMWRPKTPINWPTDLPLCAPGASMPDPFEPGDAGTKLLGAVAITSVLFGLGLILSKRYFATRGALVP